MATQVVENETSYKRVRTIFQERLRDGHWAQGQMLPGRRDLAREFGVSVATIERAMLPLITEGLLRSDGRRGTYVGRSLQSWGTQPNWANDPDTQRSGSIGIVASIARQASPTIQLSDYCTRMMVDTLERVFTVAGVTPVLLNRIPLGQKVAQPLRESLTAAMSKELDALIVLTLDCEAEQIDEALEVLSVYQNPVVCVCPGELNQPFRHVVNDDYWAGYKAAEHLLDLGHEQITVFSPFRAHWCDERIRGIRNVVQHRKLPPDAVRVMRGDDEPWQFNELQFPFTRAAVTRAWDEGWDFSGAIIAIHDIVSFGLVYLSTARDLLPGRDYALIGFDDHPVARHAGLSSVRPPLEAMAREAGRVLLSTLEGRQTGIVTKMQGELVVRSSTTLSGPEWLTADDYRRLCHDELGYDRWDQASFKH